MGPTIGRHKLVNDLKASQPHTLPRSYFNSVRDESADYYLYGFCDTSVTAYSSVVESTRDSMCMFRCIEDKSGSTQGSDDSKT